MLTISMMTGNNTFAYDLNEATYKALQRNLLQDMPSKNNYFLHSSRYDDTHMVRYVNINTTWEYTNTVGLISIKPDGVTNYLEEKDDAAPGLISERKRLNKIRETYKALEINLHAQPNAKRMVEVLIANHIVYKDPEPVQETLPAIIKLDQEYL